MFNKTTSFIFNKCGEIVNELTKHQTPKLNRIIAKLKDKSFNNFMFYTSDICARVRSEIVMLVVIKDDTARSYERFVVYRHIKIRKGVKFNFLCVSSSVKSGVKMDFRAKKRQTSTYDRNPIVYEPIVPTFGIEETLAYYYQIRNASYTFPGEKHNYWKLAFTDSNELETIVDEETHQLGELDLILYTPGQYHTWKAGHAKSYSYPAIMFGMEMPDSYLVTNHVHNTHRDIHSALNNFIKVPGNDMLYDSKLMLCYMRELLIKVLQYDFLTNSPVTSTPIQQRSEGELLNEIVVFINDNIYEQIIIGEICLKFLIPRSSLRTLFKNSLGIVPKQYISGLKLNKSKLLIKESVYTTNEIAGMMGFASTHYFSREFKQQFGTTPTDYAKTIYNQQRLQSVWLSQYTDIFTDSYLKCGMSWFMKEESTHT